MKKQNIKQQINITKENISIVPHLKSQPNISRYIISLIKKDMEKNNEDFKNKVIQIVEDYCQSCKPTHQNQENFADAIKNVLDL